MSIQLDPKEVLEHLNSLGYYNISSEQLKEFMRDLKKLIRYDEQKRQACTPKHPLTSDKCVQKDVEPFVEEEIICKCNQFYDNGEKSSVFSDDAVAEECCCSRQQDCVNNECDDDAHSCVTSCSNRSDEGFCCMTKCVKCTHLKSKPIRKENIPPRPPSSFIKSGQRTTAMKSDPVALFHHYQNLWAQRKLPGEDPHTNLRWKIRHKMMGQPRPLLRAPSSERINRPEFQF